MVVRENQGLQTALVIFVVLTIALSVSTFMFFTKYNEQLGRIAQIETSADAARAEAEEAMTQSAELKHILGAAGKDSLADIRKVTKQDFDVFPVGLAEDKRSYRQLAKQLADLLRQRESHLVTGKDRETTLETKIVADETIKHTEIEQYEESLDKATAAYADERAKMVRDVDAAARTKLAAQDKIERRQKEFDRQVTDLRSQMQTLEAKIARLYKENKDLFSRLNPPEPELEIVDAHVQGVHQGERVVWLDRGSADGLRQQVTFKVIDRDEPNPLPARSKATVEVIRILGQHAAEARIVTDSHKNPILPGDKLFSTAWQPGRAEHFALTGFMDLDGDGESDRDRVKQLIALCGGVIDAEVTEQGKLIGKVTIDTKYLISGRQLNDRASADAIKANSEIHAQARHQSVTVLSVSEFLDRVGYTPQVRLVTLKKPSGAGF